ncbi:MAG: histidine kinase, partial [Promicromonosporaceae bacterium]|nr:histidine kinase [Promicromonosporaceae bacterium]
PTAIHPPSIPGAADVTLAAGMAGDLRSRFARTGVGRDWLHLYARQRVGRACAIAQGVVTVIAVLLLALGHGDEPQLGRALVVGLFGGLHAATCWVSWHYGFFEPEQAECGAAIRPHSNLVRWLVALIVLLCAQLLVIDAPYPAASNFDQIGSYLLITSTIMFTSGVFATFLPVRMVVLVPALVVALAAVTRTIAGVPLRWDVLGLAFLVAYLLTLKLRLSGWHARLWQQWEADLDLFAALAAAEERIGIARDIHDTTGQTLAAIALKTEVAQHLLEMGDPRAIAEVREVSSLARSAIKETRGIAKGFRRTDLRTEILAARTLLEATGASLRVTGSASAWSAETREVFGWVLREAVTNVTRHAPEATTVAVELAVTGDRATMQVSNDGLTTLTRPADPQGGSGLIGLRERLGSIGGTLTTLIDKEKQFVLTATAPHPAEEYA